MDTTDESVHSYAWVKDVEAWTIAVVSGRTADEVLRIYGGDPSTSVGDLTFGELDVRRAGSDDDVVFHAQLVPQGDIVVVVENDGYSGAFPEIARRCAADRGWFFSVYWNIHAAGMVTHAVDGAITARFESLYPIAPDEQPWERRPPWATGPEVETGAARQVCMALLERQTGVTVEPGWLAEPFPAYRVPEPYALYRDVEGADRI